MINVIGAGMLLYINYEDDVEILLIHQKKSGLWGIPKGHSEKNETVLQCASREVFEEVGLDISKTLHRKEQECIKGYSTKRKYHLFKINLGYKPKIHIDYKEIDNFEWVKFKNLGNYNLNKIASKCILNFF